MIAFDPKIHDITGYEKAEIINLRNEAFKGDVKYAGKVKGSLIGLPFGQVPREGAQRVGNSWSSG